MERVECGEYGFFEYKKPNIPQGIELYSKIFPNTEELIDGVDIPTMITSKCIKHMHILVKKVCVNINGVEIKEYDEMLDQYDLIPFIMEMATSVMECLEIAIKKKSGCEKQQD